MKTIIAIWVLFTLTLGFAVCYPLVADASTVDTKIRIFNFTAKKWELVDEAQANQKLVSGGYGLEDGRKVNLVSPHDGGIFEFDSTKANELFKDGWRLETTAEAKQRVLKEKQDASDEKLRAASDWLVGALLLVLLVGFILAVWCVYDVALTAFRAFTNKLDCALAFNHFRFKVYLFLAIAALLACLIH